MNKRKFAVMSLVIFSLLLLFFGSAISSGLFDGFPILSKLWASLWIIWPATIFSIITYFMRDEVFKIWSRFSLVWIPLTVIGTLLADNSAAGLETISSAGFYLIAMSFLYIIISIVLILGTYIVLRLRKLGR